MSTCPIDTRYPKCDDVKEEININLFWKDQEIKRDHNKVYVKDRAAGAKGQYCIARMKATYVEYWNEQADKWTAFCTVYETLESAVVKAKVLDETFKVKMINTHSNFCICDECCADSKENETAQLYRHIKGIVILSVDKE